MSITHTPPRVRALILTLFPYGLLLGGLCLFGSASVVEPVTAQATCGVSTVNGVVQGQDLGNSCAFLGVPYAAAPCRQQPLETAAAGDTLDHPGPGLDTSAELPVDQHRQASGERRLLEAVESNIVFGNDYVPNQFVLHPLDANDNLLHTAMQGYWTRFARSGNPNSDDDSVVHWPGFKHPTGAGRGADKYLVFDSAIVERLRQRESACDFFEPYFFRSMLGAVPATAP